MNSSIEKINCSSWTDWDLGKMEIDYNRIVVRLSEGSEVTVTIYCNDYIGISYVGHWDESVIDRIYVEQDGNLIKESKMNIRKFYGVNPLKGGGTKEINDNWYQLNIKLMDGNSVLVACKNIVIV